MCAGQPIKAAGVFELLASLVAKSLVVAQRDGPEKRYRLLETIREYGDERLGEVGEADALRASHARYYHDEAAAQWDKHLGPDQVDGLRFLASEQENLLAALDHAVDTGDVDLALRLLRSSQEVGAVVSSEVRLPLDTVLRLPGAADHPLYPFGLAHMAFLASLRGDQVGAEVAARRLWRPPVGSVQGTEHDVEDSVEAIRMNVALGLGRWREAADHAQRTVELARCAGPRGPGSDTARRGRDGVHDGRGAGHRPVVGNRRT